MLARKSTLPLRRSRYWLRASLLMILALFTLTGCAILDAKVNYTSTMLDHMQRTSATVNSLQTLAAEPQLADAAWRETIANDIATLRTLAEEARQVTPPPALESVHQSYLGVIQTLDDFATTTEQAIALGDLNQLNQGLTLLDEATQTLNEVQQLLGGGE